MASTEPKIVIIGAGPTGLGAGYRLKELGYRNFKLYDRLPYTGGLASSFTDSAGFTWDIGGHVMFSHYKYYDKCFDDLMGSDFQLNNRECWVRMFNTWVPYPFQNNIRHLPKEVTYECLAGLVKAQAKGDHRSAKNFREFIDKVFGDGIAKHFMMPYNFKVWAHPPELMNKEWIGERVSVVDIARVLGNVVLDRDDAGWGPNSTFKYPRHGGTGGLFERMRPYVRENLKLCAPVSGVDIEAKQVLMQDGTRESYDILLNTTPVDLLVKSISGDVPD